MLPISGETELRLAWFTLNPSYRRSLIGLLLINGLAFGPFITQPIFAPDDHSVLAPLGLIWQQRFPTDRPVADQVFPYLFSGAAAPFLQLCLFITANVVSALLLGAHWRLKRTLDIILVGALITTCPAWADQYTFLLNTVRFIPLAFPMAIIAYLLALKRSILARIAALILISLSIGLYQLGINNYIMLGIIDVVLLTLLSPISEAWQYAKKHLLPAIAIVLLAAMVFIFYMRFMFPHGMGRADLSLTPINSLSELKNKFDMYLHLADALFRGTFVGLFSYGPVVVYSLVSVGTLAGLFYIFRQFSLPEAAIRACIFVALIITLFTAILATQSFNLYNKLFLRVMVSAGLFLACFLLLTIHTECIFRLGHRLAVAFSALLCFIFITTDGYIHSLGVMADRADLLIASRMAARIERQNATEKPLPLVVIGTSRPFLGLPHLQHRGSLFLSSRPWLDAPVSSFTAWWAKRPIFHHIGHDFLIPNREQILQACAFSQTMPVWPAKSSVLVKEGISVIKLGRPVPSDACPSDLR